MKLELGRRADYAIRCVVALAGAHGDGQRHKAADIAADMDVPVSYVPRILAKLVRAGITESLAGRDGGYRLARDPAAVSLLDVVSAVDGELSSTACVLRSGPCRWHDACAVHEPWARAQQALLDELAATSLADVVATDRQLQAGTYRLPPELQGGRRR